MGVSIREKDRGSGVWWVFVRHQGRRISRRVGDLKAARKAKALIEAELIRNPDLVFQRAEPEEMAEAQPKPAPVSFKTYSHIWLENYIRAVRRRNTYDRYKQLLRDYINPVIGKLDLTAVNRGHIKALLLDQKKRGFSRSHIGVVKDVISGVFNYAFDEELVEKNPCNNILKHLDLERDKTGNMRPFDHEETRHFLAICRQHFPEEYPFFLCAFSTGLRLGELLALEWSDIEWHKKRLEVSKSFGRGRIERPKNKKNRWVDLTDHLFLVLRGLHTRRKREALAAGTGEPLAVVFHRKGLHIPQNSIRHIFNRILAKAGLRKIRFHDIRHTYISLLISSGAKLNYVMEQAGHHSIKMTVDRYADYIPSGETSEVNLLDFGESKADERVFVRGE